MNLSEIRKKYKKSQNEVANAINISQSNYSKYEQNTIEPSIDTLIKLAKYFNVTTDELLGIKKEEITLTERNSLIKKINTLTEIECFKVSNYVDGIISNRIENKDKERIFKIIKDEK